MNKEQYEALDLEQKLVAVEAYIDGFRACIEQVKSIVVRVGEQEVDNMFQVHRDMIVGNLDHTYEKFLLATLVKQ